MTSVSVGPPDLKNVDPTALSIAKFLRRHPLLKQREGIINEQRKDFFRVKRAIRALESEDYKKASSKPNSRLPQITDREQALAALKLLPINRLAFQVVKLDTEDAIKANLKPKAGVPCLQINPNQGFEDDFYYCWFYEPVSITTYLYAGLALGTIFAVVLFPLWPLVMRKGVWYLSMAFLGLIASFFGIALIRLVLFCITYVVLKPGLWIFPNLFEDVGVIESFIPFWAWHGVDTMAMHKPKKRISKKKKLAKLEKKKAQEAAAQQTQQTAQQAAQQAANAQIVQGKLQGINARLVALAEERAKAGNPVTSEEIQALGQKWLTEELGPNFQLQMGPPPSQQQHSHDHSHEHGHDHSHDDGHGHSHGDAPSERIVLLEDEEEK
ncbi:hypothetical protein DV495_000489 [Geotrichum candidum]|nr:hypothetical protein DV495_000489 [Geotrichum candidum]KAI9212433.1 hypothetical protein DS838_002710 [Geotrichum bryndzae]